MSTLIKALYRITAINPDLLEFVYQHVHHDLGFTISNLKETLKPYKLKKKTTLYRALGFTELEDVKYAFNEIPKKEGQVITYNSQSDISSWSYNIDAVEKFVEDQPYAIIFSYNALPKDSIVDLTRILKDYPNLDDLIESHLGYSDSSVVELIDEEQEVVLLPSNYKVKIVEIRGVDD